MGWGQGRAQSGTIGATSAMNGEGQEMLLEPEEYEGALF